jgi:hypothetical protein
MSYASMLYAANKRNIKCYVVLDTKSGNLKKVSSSNRIQCPTQTGLSVQCTPDFAPASHGNHGHRGTQLPHERSNRIINHKIKPPVYEKTSGRRFITTAFLKCHVYYMFTVPLIALHINTDTAQTYKARQERHRYTRLALW